MAGAARAGRDGGGGVETSERWALTAWRIVLGARRIGSQVGGRRERWNGACCRSNKQFRGVFVLLPEGGGQLPDRISFRESSADRRISRSAREPASVKEREHAERVAPVDYAARPVRRWCRTTSARGAAGVRRGARAQAVQGRAQEGAGRAGGAGRARRTVWRQAGGRSLCNMSPRRPFSF